MRKELLDLYKLACDTSDKDVIKQFQRARDRIGPTIIIDECLKVDRLEKHVDELYRKVEELTKLVESP